MELHGLACFAVPDFQYVYGEGNNVKLGVPLWVHQGREYPKPVLAAAELWWPIAWPAVSFCKGAASLLSYSPQPNSGILQPF